MMNQARKKERAEFLKSELKKEDLMESNNIDDDDDLNVEYENEYDNNNEYEDY